MGQPLFVGFPIAIQPGIRNFSVNLMSKPLPTTILIIDDDENLRNLLTVILEVADIQAICAANAKQALAALNNQSSFIQGVFLDLNLNHVKGEDLYDEIVAIDPGIAVFPMSGCLREEIEERFAGKRINGIITKPFLPSDIIRVIKNALPKRRSPATSDRLTTRSSEAF